MIESIKFNFSTPNWEHSDNKFKYAYKFLKGKFPNDTLEFKDGINIIVGENGSGKSTIIDMIRTMCFVRGSFHNSELNKVDLDLRVPLKLMDCVDIKAAYDITCFNMYNMGQMSRFEEAVADHDLTRIRASQMLSYDEESTGEKVFGDLSQMINTAFSGNVDMATNLYDTLKENPENKKLLKWYAKNASPKRNVTMIMDEPDKGVSLTNIEQLTTVLSYDRGDTQIICALHNPLLIKALSCIDNINIIEFTPNYVGKIDKYVSRHWK